jgi:hypothetical protein
VLIITWYSYTPPSIWYQTRSRNDDDLIFFLFSRSKLGQRSICLAQQEICTHCFIHSFGQLQFGVGQKIEKSLYIYSM